MIKLDMQPAKLPSLTQEVKVNVAHEGEKKVDIPVKVSVTGPSETERNIDLKIHVVPAGKLEIPVSFRVDGFGSLNAKCDCDCCRERREDKKNNVQKGRVNEKPPAAPDQDGQDVDKAKRARALGYAILFGIIITAGIIGGWIRWRELTRERLAKITDELDEIHRVRYSEPAAIAAPAGGPAPGKSVDDREKKLEAERTQLQSSWLMHIAWGMLASLLVPAIFAVGSTDFLNDVQAGSPIHVVALGGFCIIAASLGAEVLVRLQHLARTGSWKSSDSNSNRSDKRDKPTEQ